MIALALALLLGNDGKECRYLASNPPQAECSWSECSAGVCRRVTVRESTACSCVQTETRTECDADGKNCRTWTRTHVTGDPMPCPPRVAAEAKP